MAYILVADDDQGNRKFLTRMLTFAGHTVGIAENGQVALLQTLERRPDLILLDMAMPVLDGWGTISALKADPDLATIPVVAVTALALSGDRQRILKAGFNDYLSKPFEYPDLITTIQRWTVS